MHSAEDLRDVKSTCVFSLGVNRTKRDTEKRLPQQLCHYVGGNYESDKNGEGERIGAKSFNTGA